MKKCRDGGFTRGHTWGHMCTRMSRSQLVHRSCPPLPMHTHAWRCTHRCCTHTRHRQKPSSGDPPPPHQGPQCEDPPPPPHRGQVGMQGGVQGGGPKGEL